MRLTTDQLEVDLYPEHGFVIGAIRHHTDPRNILWNPDGASFDPLPAADLGPAGDASVDTFDRQLLAGGWFAMFPNAGLPSDITQWMHGEAPRLAWKVISAADTEVTCALRTPASGFRVERTVRVDGNTVAVTTRAVNDSGDTQQVAPGEHPCFSREVFAGGVLIADPDRAEVTSHADELNATLAASTPFTWPNAPLLEGGTTDLRVIPEEPDGRHDHVTLTGSGRVTAVGSTLAASLMWDQDAFPHSLLWEHFQPLGSPWAGDVFAIEPAHAPGRTSADAAAANAVTTVAPGETVTSWVQLQVEATARQSAENAG